MNENKIQETTFWVEYVKLTRVRIKQNTEKPLHPVQNNVYITKYESIVHKNWRNTYTKMVRKFKEL